MEVEFTVDQKGIAYTYIDGVKGTLNVNDTKFLYNLFLNYKEKI